MKIEELTTDENNDDDDDDEVNIPTLHHSASRRGAICAFNATIGTALPDNDASEPSPTVPRNFFRSHSKKSLILRIRTTPGVVAADRLGSVVYHRIRPYIETYVHRYDVYPLCSPSHLTTLTFHLANEQAPSLLKLALRKKPILLRFTVPPSQTPLWDKRLRAFPPEIRNMVLEWMLRNSWNGRTPNLVKALRSSKRDQDLYYDAMFAFYKSNCYTLNHRNGWSFGDMSVIVLKTIRTLGIDIGYPGLHFHWYKLFWTIRTASPHLVFHTLHFTDTLAHIAPGTNAFAFIPTAAFIGVAPNHPVPPGHIGPNPPIHPTVLPQAAALAAREQRRMRDERVARFLHRFLMPPSVRRPGYRKRRNGLRLVILNTQLDMPRVLPLVWNIGNKLRAIPKLVSVPTGNEMIWFWDMDRGKDTDLLEDIERYEKWPQTANYD